MSISDLMRLNGVKSLKKPDPVKTERISREDFDLLDVQDENTIYYIIEDNGQVTVKKGE